MKLESDLRMKYTIKTDLGKRREHGITQSNTGQAMN